MSKRLLNGEPKTPNKSSASGTEVFYQQQCANLKAGIELLLGFDDDLTESTLCVSKDKLKASIQLFNQVLSQLGNTNSELSQKEVENLVVLEKFNKKNVINFKTEDIHLLLKSKSKFLKVGPPVGKKSDVSSN